MKVRKIVAIVSLILVVIILATMLTACKPSGTYGNTIASYTFSGSKYTYNLFGYEAVNGSFKIKDDKIYFTVDGDEENTELGLSYGKDGDEITIANVKYTKSK